MHHAPLIRDLLAEGRESFSFEFMPPKTEADERQLWRAIRTLEPLHPTFVSVLGGMNSNEKDSRPSASRSRMRGARCIPRDAMGPRL